MRNLTQSIFGLAIFSALLAGCGGGGTDAPAPGGSLNVTGGATLITASSASAIPASGSPASFTFGGTSAMVPAGIAISAGSPVAIVGTSTPVLGLQGTGAFSVNGAATGVTFHNGSLSSSVALPPTSGAPYAIAAIAPVGGFVIPGAGSMSRGIGTSLTINDRFVLGVPVLGNGTAGFPISISGKVPVNGSNAANVSLTVRYPAAFAGYQATLAIAWTSDKSQASIQQTKTVSSAGYVTFSAKSDHAIPAGGVDSVALSLSPAN